jgi:hypothetical protein
MPGTAVVEVKEKEIEFALWSVQKGFVQIAPNTRQLSVMLPKQHAYSVGETSGLLVRAPRILPQHGQDEAA